MSHNPSDSQFDSRFSPPPLHRPYSSISVQDAFPSSLDSVHREERYPAPPDPSREYNLPPANVQPVPLRFFDSSSQPILASFQPPRFDSNSFEDFPTAYGDSEQVYEAATPSYCGSWTSDYSASASPSRYSHSTPLDFHQRPGIRPSSSYEYLYDQTAIKTEQLSLEPQFEEMAPFDSTTFEEPRAEPALHGGLDGPNAQRDRDMTINVPRKADSQGTAAAGGGGGEGGSGSAQRPYAFTRSSSGFGAFLNYANSPTTERGRPATPAYSATRSTVYDASTGSNARPTNAAPASSVGSISPTVATTSSSSNGIPALTKLEIPTAPSVSLTGPTPETAKPRPKGRGTLELERVLGLWAAKTPTSSFPNLPPLSAIGPPSPTSTATPPSSQPLFTQSIVSSEPESFVPGPLATTSTSETPGGTASATTSYSSNNTSFPEFGSRDRSSGDSLVPPSFGPRRRRSKSDTDVMRADSLGFPHSNLPVGPYVDPPPIITDRPTFASTIAPPTPVEGPTDPNQHFSMNPSETWRSPFPPSSSYTTNPPAATDSNSSTQRELSSRSRSPLSNRNHREVGGPGYHGAALLDVSADGGRNRRARSQGAGHRSSKSDDFSHFLPTMQQSISQPILTTTSDGLLAPPPPPQAPSPAHPGVGSPVPSQADSPYLQSQSLPQPPVQGLSPGPAQAASPYHSQSGSPFPSHASPYPQPQQPIYSAPTPQGPTYVSQASPDQGYLANQAALLASAALIAFNPTDPAHAAAAAAGYLPPSYPHYPPPYNLPSYPSPYGPHAGLPPLPSHHQVNQLPYPPPRSANGLSHATRASLAAASSSSRDPSPSGTRLHHPAYAYHSPLGQLPSPPPTGTTRASTRGGARRRSAANVVKADPDHDADEDELMRMDEDDAEGQIDEERVDDGEDEQEDELDEDGGIARGGAVKGKGKRAGGKGGGRAKRQVSEEGFSEKSKTTQATIDAAKRRRNANAVAKFVCDLCGETFTRRYNLRGHQRAHNGEKPYKCSYDGCDKAFARAHDCKRHELLHLGVRKYHCSPCKRDFVRLDALHRHHRSEVGQACVKQLEAEGYVFDDKGAAVAL